MSKPRLLDLFGGACGAGRGYQLAGFEVISVDNRPQPNSVADVFVQMDVFDVQMDWIRSFDAIHASPPCQHYANVTRWRGNQDDHPDLIWPTRQLLQASGLPWVIENVETDAVRADFKLCGSMVGLPIRRHRHFETNWHPFGLSPLQCQHKSSDYSFDHGKKQPESVYRDAMGCEWMTVLESREAIPPAYTKLIGKQLLEHLGSQ